MNLPGRGILHLLVEQGSLNLEVQGGEFRVPQHDKHPITSHPILILVKRQDVAVVVSSLD